MNKLNVVEIACQAVLRELLDAMAAGRPMHHHDHREMMGRMRSALARLENKEFGCWTGEHRGGCHCEPGRMDHPHLQRSKFCARPGCAHTEHQGGTR